MAATQYTASECRWDGRKFVNETRSNRDQVLAALQRDGRLSNRELAERVHLSESACLRRVRALEEAGVIDRYAALVNQARSACPATCS